HVSAERFGQGDDDCAVERDLRPADGRHGLLPWKARNTPKVLSEALGTDQSVDKIAEQEQGDDAPEDIVERHSLTASHREQHKPRTARKIRSREQGRLRPASSPPV